ncbi:FRG domain-containing protein [uncultured Methanocorpusculum sp.]|nr:FRG domain-containing protein [uncultured Methanocorpusculum sp.]
MTKDEVSDDILEAIRKCDTHHPILKLRENPNRVVLRSSNAFEIMGCDNGKAMILPIQHMLRTHYRGEKNIYDTCIPAIYRNNPSDAQILIEKLKILDFISIMKTFPQIQFAEENGLDVRYEALAQHYGLKTDIIDVTSDICVAAFFATHEYDIGTNRYLPKTSGSGVIRIMHGLGMIPDENAELIGAQPFQRPTVQDAFGLRMRKGEDLTTRSGKIVFKQNIFWSQKIEDLFRHNHVNLFPREIIANVADSIRLSNSVTQLSIDEYCESNGMCVNEIADIVLDAGYSIRNTPQFVLSDKVRDMLKKDVQDQGYGVKFTARLQGYLRE